MANFKGSVGTSLQMISIKPKRKKRSKLTQLEKLERGIDCAKGSDLKYYPNEPASAEENLICPKKKN